MEILFQAGLGLRSPILL